MEKTSKQITNSKTPNKMNKQELLISKDELLDIINRNSKHPNCAVTIWQAVEKYLISQRVEAMNTPAKEGMKWVKASERLPERTGEYIYKTVHGFVGQAVFVLPETTHNEFFHRNVFAWLDESAPAKEVDKIFTKEDARILLNNFQEYVEGHKIDPPYSFSTLVNMWIDDYTALNFQNAKEVEATEQDLAEAMSECKRLAEVAEYWQAKYYELNPPAQPVKLDNL